MNRSDPLSVLIQFGATPNFVWKLGEGRERQMEPYCLPGIPALKTIGDILDEIKEGGQRGQGNVPHLMGFGEGSRENLWRALVRYLVQERQE